MIDNLLIFVQENQGQAPEWIKILPLGKVAMRDKRPPFEVTSEDLDAIVRKFRSDGVDLVVDYEHQSLTGEKAPAAGWIKDLEARADGLYARVEWTLPARQHIEAKEYRYYSPVVRLNSETRRPLALMHAALTNTPALTNLEALAAKYEALAAQDTKAAQAARAKKYGIGVKEGGHVTKPGEWSQVPDEQFADPVNYRYPMPDRDQCRAAWSYWNQAKNQEQYSPEERAKIGNRIKTRAKEVGMQIAAKEEATAMLGKLKAKLGMKPEASEEEVLALVDQRAGEAVALKDMTADLIKELALPAETTPAQLKGAILALKQGQDQLTGLQKEVSDLRAERQEERVQAAVSEVLAAGKITPAQKDWALKYARQDLEGFKTFASEAPKLIPVGEEFRLPRDGSKLASLPADAPVDQVLALKAQELAAKEKIDLGVATERVLRENPELAKEWEAPIRAKMAVL